MVIFIHVKRKLREEQLNKHTGLPLTGVIVLVLKPGSRGVGAHKEELLR